MTYMWTPNELAPVTIQEDADLSVSVLVVSGGSGGGGGGGDAAWGDIGGDILDQTDLQDALAGKADAEHTHTVGDIEAEGDADGTTFLRGDGVWAAPEVGAATWGSVTGTLGDQTDLQDALDGKADIAHNHSASDITSGTLAVNRGGTGSTGFITPTNYTPGGATVAFHLGGIDTALGQRVTTSAMTAAISSAIGGLAAVASSGDFADLANTPTTLDGYGITDAAGVEHTHAVGDIEAEGDADGTTFLRGDGVWAAPEVGAAAWGSVTGTLGDQTDLQDALDGKADIAHNHSASDITSGTLAVNRGGTGSTGFITPTNYTPGGATVSFHLAGIDTALGNRPTSSAVSDAISSAIGGLADVAASGDWADLTGTPTTLAGYGITDAAPADLALAELRCTFDGGGAVLEDAAVTTVIARACVLTAAYLVADAAGDVTVTVKRDRGGTETTLGTLTLTAQDGSSLTDLSGWAATDLAAGDRLTAEAADAATITHLGLVLGRKAAAS